MIDGPFSETTALVAGFWIIPVRSKAEAIAWASRVPFADDEVIEVRQVLEASDVPPETIYITVQASQDIRHDHLTKWYQVGGPGILTGPNGQALRVVTVWIPLEANGETRFATLFPDRETSMTQAKIEVYQRVAFTRDLPEHNLRKGDVAVGVGYLPWTRDDV